MAGDIKQKIVLEGEKQYNAALKEAQRNLKTLRSELKAETAELGNNATAQQKNEVRAKNLQKQIKEQEQIVKTYKAALEEVRKNYGDNDEAVAKWEQKLNEARATLANMQNSLEDVGTAFKDVDKDANLGVVATKSFADSLKAVGDAAGGIADSLEQAFQNVLGVIQNIVSDLWGQVMDIASKANNWTDLADMFGTSATEIQKWDRALSAAGKDFNLLGSMMTTLAKGKGDKTITEWLGISDVNYNDELAYTMVVLQKMKELWDDPNINRSEWNKRASEIFKGGANDVRWLMANWDVVMGNTERFDVENGGLGLDAEDIKTMNQLALDAQTLSETWTAFKESFLAGAVGQLSLDLVGNVQGMLDAFIAFMNGDDSALDDLENNMEEFFTRLGEAIGRAAEALDATGERLQGSDNGYVRLIGDALRALSDVLEWFADSGNVDKVVKGFEALAAVWLTGKGAQMIAKIASLVANIKLIKGFGIGGEALSAGASGATSGVSGATSGGVGAWLGGKAAALFGAGSSFSMMGGLSTFGPLAAFAVLGKVGWDLVQANLKDADLNQIYGTGGNENNVIDTMSDKSWFRMWEYWQAYRDNYGSEEAMQARDELYAQLEADGYKLTEDAVSLMEGMFDNWLNGNDSGGLVEQVLQRHPEFFDSEGWNPTGYGQGGANITSADLERFNSVPGLMQQAVRAGVSGISVTMDGQKVGQLVAPYVSQSISYNIIE